MAEKKGAPPRKLRQCHCPKCGAEFQRELLTVRPFKRRWTNEFYVYFVECVECQEKSIRAWLQKLKPGKAGEA